MAASSCNIPPPPGKSRECLRRQLFSGSKSVRLAYSTFKASRRHMDIAERVRASQACPPRPYSPSGGGADDLSRLPVPAEMLPWIRCSKCSRELSPLAGYQLHKFDCPRQHRRPVWWNRNGVRLCGFAPLRAARRNNSEFHTAEQAADGRESGFLLEIRHINGC